MLPDIPSSVLVRAARGDGEARPEPVGENICRLAEGSRDMPGLAVEEVSVCGLRVAGHACLGLEGDFAVFCLESGLEQ